MNSRNKIQTAVFILLLRFLLPGDHTNIYLYIHVITRKRFSFLIIFVWCIFFYKMQCLFKKNILLSNLTKNDEVFVKKCQKYIYAEFECSMVNVLRLAWKLSSFMNMMWISVVGMIFWLWVNSEVRNRIQLLSHLPLLTLPTVRFISKAFWRLLFLLLFFSSWNFQYVC